MLTKEDCRQRAPCDGDVIYNMLTVLVNNVPRVDGMLALYTYLLTYLLTTSGHVLSTPAGKLTSITEMEMSNVITAGCLAL